jgi:hypothetical protein
MSDEEILKMDNVPVKVASKYLGLALMSTYYGLQDHAFPFGTAIKNPGGHWTYSISPGLLVAYKRGTLKIQVINQAANI